MSRLSPAVREQQPTPRTAVTAPQAPYRWHVLLLGVVTLVALALRLYTLVSPLRGIWIDEAFSIWMAQQPLPQMLGLLRTLDTHPPLFYLLLHVWVLPRHDPLWVRLLPALLGTATVPAAYGLGARLAGRRYGLLCALLFALSPVLVQYGQEVRMYGLVVLLSVLSLWALLAALAGGGAWRWCAFVAATAALLLSYNEAVFLPGAEVLYVATVERRWRTLIAGGLSFAAVAALWGLWLPVTLQQFSGISDRFWIPPPDPARVVNTFLTLLNAVDIPTLAAGRGAGPLSPLGPWLLAPAALLLAWGVRAMGRIGDGAYRRWGVGETVTADPPYAPTPHRSHARTPHRPHADTPPRPYAVTPARTRWLLLAAALLPHLGALAASRVSPVYLDRSLLYSESGLLPLAAAGILALPGRALPLLVGAVWCALQVAGLGHYYQDATKEDWQGVARQVAAQARPGDLVLFSGSWLQLAFDYSYQGPLLVENGLPVDLFERGEREPPMRSADAARLPSLVGSASQVWLVFGHQQFDDPQAIVRPALHQLFGSETGTPYRGGLTVYRYSNSVAVPPQRLLDDRFGAVAQLSGISAQRQGSNIVVTLTWQALGRSDNNLTVFVHLLKPDGTLLAQRDAEPLSGTQHTTSWLPGARLVDPYPIAVAGAQSDPLSIEIGLYDPLSGKRVAATGPEAQGGDHLLVRLPGNLSP